MDLFHVGTLKLFSFPAAFAADYAILDTAERGQPISVRRVVVVGVAVRVDFAEISRIARIRRTLPPVGRA